MKYLSDYKTFENSITFGGSLVGRLFYELNRNINNTINRTKLKMLDVFDSDEDKEQDKLTELENNKHHIDELLNKIKKMSDDKADIFEIINFSKYTIEEINKIDSLPDKNKILNQLDGFISDLEELKIKEKEESDFKKYGTPPTQKEEDDLNDVEEESNLFEEEPIKHKLKNEMVINCAKEVVRKQSASITNLMSKFDLDLNKAADIIEELERCGIVGPLEGMGPRKVLVRKIGDLDEYIDDRYKSINAKPVNTKYKSPDIERRKNRVLNTINKKPKVKINKNVSPEKKQTPKTSNKKKIKNIPNTIVKPKKLSKSDIKKQRKKRVKDFYDFMNKSK